LEAPGFIIEMNIIGATAKRYIVIQKEMREDVYIL